METIKNIFKGLWAGIRVAFKNTPRKVIYVIAGLVICAAKQHWPEFGAMLPTVDFLTDVIMALLAAHTVTDIASIAGASLVEHAKAKLPKEPEDKK